MSEIEQQDAELEKEGDSGEEMDEKPKLTPEQIRGIKMRQYTKLSKELGMQKDSGADALKPGAKEGFDYAELSYLEVKGVQDDDHEYVLETLKDSGKSLRDLMSAKWFQSDLKERQASRASKNAIPSGKRSTSTARDSVDYWMNKPFAEVPKEMKREVLKAKQKTESNRSRFTDRSIGNITL